jgi:hypothetical protein
MRIVRRSDVRVAGESSQPHRNKPKIAIEFATHENSFLISELLSGFNVGFWNAAGPQNSLGSSHRQDVDRTSIASREDMTAKSC